MRRETVEEQARRASRRGSAETARATRLDRVFAEGDAETQAELGGVAAMSYRFTCQHCGSRFSLQQQLEEHEAACGEVGQAKEKGTTSPTANSRACKFCGRVFENFGEYGAHRWAAHRGEVLAELAKRRQQRKADEKKIDAKIRGNGHGAGAPPPSARPSKAVSAPGPTCPTCGGILPETTAQLVKELAAAGIPETQAFEAARIARRVLMASEDN